MHRASARRPPGGQRLPATGRRLDGTWWALFGLALLIGALWCAAAPPLTGPDEVSQVRRAAAVGRGQFLGRHHPATNALAIVDVPSSLGSPAERLTRCWILRPLDGDPQPPRPSEPPGDRCSPGPARTMAGDQLINQQRGQPTAYLLASPVTFLATDHLTFTTLAVRSVVMVASAALIASALRTVTAGRSMLGAVLTLGALPPMSIYLGAVANPSGIEQAAAACAWTAVGAIARDLAPSPRLVARASIGLVVLALTRGFGPLFVLAVLGAFVAVTGLRPTVRLLRSRRDVGAGAVAVAAAMATSLGWLVYVQVRWPLPTRSGAGLATAATRLPWFLRQAVGVFGANDNGLGVPAAATWLVITAATLALALPTLRRRARWVVIGLGVAGVALTLSAEGLSLPPIGFFWQGRYGLPLLTGGLLLAAGLSPPRRRSSVGVGPITLAGALVAIHGVALTALLHHYAIDAYGDQRTMALPIPVSVGMYVVVLAALVAVVLRGGRRPRDRNMGRRLRSIEASGAGEDTTSPRPAAQRPSGTSPRRSSTVAIVGSKPGSHGSHPVRSG